MTSAAVVPALLEWVNDFPLPHNITSTTQLDDGLVLWEILKDIDPTYFGHGLPSPQLKDPDHWLPKWQNLKQINKDVLNYIRDECAQTLYLHAKSVPDSKIMANGNDGAELETVKLLKIILLATIYSPKATEYIARMPSLSTGAQEVIRSIIEEMSSDSLSGQDSTFPLEDATSKSDGRPTLDPELVFEERLGKVMADNDKLVKNNKELSLEVEELHTRLVRLQDNNQALQERLTEAEDKLERSAAARKGYGADADVVIRRLELRIKEQEDYIAHNETKLATAQAQRDDRDRTIDSFQVQHATTQKLQDELDEIRIERDHLAKKANMADRYKQKLQATQSLETENRHLRSEVDELHQRSRADEDALTEARGHQMTLEQYRKTVQRVEQDYSEIQTIKRRLELDNNALQEKLESSVEQRARDGDMIADLQDKIRELESGAVPEFDQNGSLENELVVNDKTKADLRLDISKLKAELQRVKDSNSSGAEGVMYRDMLDDANQKIRSSEQKYLDMYQGKLLLESQLKALSEGKLTEGDEVFFKLRESLLQLQDELSRTKERLVETENDLAGAQRSLTAARSDLSLIGKDELATLEELKRTSNAELVELGKAHEEVQRCAKEQASELDQHKSLLNNALLDKGSMQERLAGSKDQLHQCQVSNAELKNTLEVLKTATSSHGEGAQASLSTHIVQLQEKNEKLREKFVRRTEHIKKQNTLIADVTTKLQRAEQADETAVTTMKTNQQVSSPAPHRGPSFLLHWQSDLDD
ncbi:MAG: hypothetical protein M1817_004478 [Caeruleum heppii]|nr:MAG: hypothetical protein M1817_004478 [Caeruleum heppii]